MRLPSISQIGTEYARTVRRFPLAFVGTLVATIAGIILVEQEANPQPSIFYSILQPAILALPFLAALKLAVEGENRRPGLGWTLRIIGAALLVVYAFTIPSNVFAAPMYYTFRFTAFLIGCFFLFSFLPFLRKGQANAFWQFNRIIVFRVILAGAFSMVLFAGLGLALGALDNLFGINIPPRRYFELWILILGLFSAPFVLAGIPENLPKLDEVTDYPRPLKVLGQYVLPPLVLVYFLILYVYVAKIIITWSWPQGWVGRLILGFAATGIVALFVLDPLREKIESLWLKRATRWYYLILLPLIVVLVLALWRRISEYGLTEDRYLGLAIAVWLTFVAGYFLLSRAKNIKMIPASLCVLTFVISVGPWGMFSVSERSQIQRLKTILVADSILVNGTVQKAPSTVSGDDQKQISSILSYLSQVHGLAGIQPWFSEDLRTDSAGDWTWFKNLDYVAGLMGIKFDPYGILGSQDKYFTVYANLQTPISISGYDNLVRAKYSSMMPTIDSTAQEIPCEVETTPDSLVMKFTADGIPGKSYTILLRPLLDRMVAAHAMGADSNIPAAQATLNYEIDDLKAKIVMTDAYFQKSDSAMVVLTYGLLIFYSLESGK